MIGTKWVATITGPQWLVAKIHVRDRKVKILKFFSFDLAEDTSNQSDAAEKLKRLLNTNHIPSKKLSLAFSNPGIITRIVTIPIMKRKLLDTLFTEQLDQYFTLNIADYIIDYRILTEVEQGGNKLYQILLVAFPRDAWDQQLQLLQDAKVKPQLVDVQFECLTRLYTRLETADSVIINFFKNRAEIVILEHGIFFLYSDVVFDAHAIVSSAENNLEQVENVFYPVIRNLEDFLEFFKARHFGKTVDVIYLMGEYVSLKGLVHLFEQNFEIQTKIGYPMDWKPEFAKKVAVSDENKLGGLIGLAMRED